MTPRVCKSRKKVLRDGCGRSQCLLTHKTYEQLFGEHPSIMCYVNHMPGPLIKKVVARVFDSPEFLRVAQSCTGRFRTKDCIEPTYLIFNYHAWVHGHRRMPKAHETNTNQKCPTHKQFEKTNIAQLSELLQDSKRPKFFCINSGFGDSPEPERVLQKLYVPSETSSTTPSICVSGTTKVPNGF